MERIRNKIFSIEEANRLIPYLEGALASLSALGQEVTALRREIEVLGAIAGSGASIENPDVRSLREKEQAYAGALDRFRSALTEVARHGCIIRDLELGLVDFYTTAKDRVVCLCWRRGEPAVGHWHPIDEGFSGRRPLEELF
ncbi:MAG TPA: DUF2203 domain-containing protein [Candidatus Eisenbacteria bacterium]